jgi:peptidoglycan hydrolase-like amidase
MIRETNPEANTALANVVTAADRIARWGHSGAHIHLTGPVVFADATERALFLRGALVVRPGHQSQETIENLTAAGALVVTHTISDGQTVTLTNEHAAVTNVDDLLHFLEARSILTGGSNG